MPPLNLQVCITPGARGHLEISTWWNNCGNFSASTLLRALAYFVLERFLNQSFPGCGSFHLKSNTTLLTLKPKCCPEAKHSQNGRMNRHGNHQGKRGPHNWSWTLTFVKHHSQLGHPQPRCCPRRFDVSGICLIYRSGKSSTVKLMAWTFSGYLLEQATGCL